MSRLKDEFQDEIIDNFNNTDGFTHTGLKMTENKQCRDAFEKWSLEQGWDIDLSADARQRWTVWQAAYNLHHNEAPTGEIKLNNGSKINFVASEGELKGSGVDFFIEADKPTGEIGVIFDIINNLISRQEKRKNAGFFEIINNKEFGTERLVSDYVIALKMLEHCKSHLQQAQKMRSALEDIEKLLFNMKQDDAITVTGVVWNLAKQALNNKE